MNDDVREIVARVGMEAWGQEFSGDFGEPALRWDDIDEADQMSHRRIADAILAALADAGYAVVERDRVERLIAVGEAVEVWLADAKTMLPSQLVRMSPEARRYLQQVIDLEYPFLPGDLDPLPERGE